MDTKGDRIDQVLTKFSLGGRGAGGVFLGSWVVKNQSSKFWPSFHFFGRGGYSWVVKTQSAKFWPSFHGGGRGEGGSWVQMGIGILGKMSKNFAMPYSGSPCIADSLSHTTCVKIKN